MKGIEVSPGNLTVANPVHRRLVLFTPRVRKDRPVDVDVSFRAEFLPVTDHATSPVHDCSKNVEDERVDIW